MTRNYRIIVPVYNGGNFITSFIKRVPIELYKYLLFVNDGSSDNTEDRLNAADVEYISYPDNRGKGGALSAGIGYCQACGVEYAIVIDVDLQHPPEDLGKFTTFEPNTIQLGYRALRKPMPLHRKVSNFLTSLFISVRTNTVIKDSQCGFRAFPMALFTGLDFVSRGFQLESEMLIRAGLLGYRVVHHPIPAIYGEEPTQMNNVGDTLRFVKLWFRSFFWT